MGTRRPKRTREERLEELEEAVNDAVLTETTDDRVLAFLLELTITSLTEERPLFPNPLDEPLLYRRHFRKWVEEGLREATDIQKAMEPPED
jgi:hypothetical protein